MTILQRYVERETDDWHDGSVAKNMCSSFNDLGYYIRDLKI